MPNASNFIVENGQLAWFDGPEWDDVAEVIFERAAIHVAEVARNNAPWDDRTGDARRGLTTTVENDQGLISLYLFHTVDYGLWLEVIQNGRFAIIMPTLEQEAPAIFAEAAVAVAVARNGRN